MVIWYKVKWIDPLFAAFNQVFPNRGKASDGTIGDLEHAQGTSGHNPDDTPGVSAERSDSDTKPEVRAADVTSTLNDPRGVTMQQVINKILVTPTDLVRLIYIIYNRKIWKKSNGWREEPYTGSDPHTGHAHLSGDPAYDEDGSPWQSILSFGVDMDANQAGQLEQLHAMVRQVYWRWAPTRQQFLNAGGSASAWDFGGGLGTGNADTPYMTKIYSDMAAGLTKLGEGLAILSQKLDELAVGGVTHEALVAAFTDPAVVAAMKQAAFEGAQQAEDE